jgi:hypothetical protein
MEQTLHVKKKEHFFVWNLSVSDLERNSELNLQKVAVVSLVLCKMVVIEYCCM